MKCEYIVNYGNNRYSVNYKDEYDDDNTIMPMMMMMIRAKGLRPVVTWLVMTYHSAEVETTLICLNNNTPCFDTVYFFKCQKLFQKPNIMPHMP